MLEIYTYLGYVYSFLKNINNVKYVFHYSFIIIYFKINKCV